MAAAVANAVYTEAHFFPGAPAPGGLKRVLFRYFRAQSRSFLVISGLKAGPIYISWGTTYRSCLHILGSNVGTTCML